MINRLRGVNLVGYSKAEMGIGESCRLAAKSLKYGNIPFGVIDFRTGNSARMYDNSLSYYRMHTPRYNTNIFHINADQMPLVYNQLGEQFFRSADYNIGYWAWELPEFPDEWLNSFNLVNEVWTPSAFVTESISKKSPVPVITVPPCIEFLPSNRFNRASFGLKENMFLFLMMYDSHSIQERKNPYAALNAFREASKNSNIPMGLVIKVNNSKSDPKQVEKLREETKGEHVFILEGTMMRNEVYSLINLCDCFISLHRSEGFGLVMAEAMFLGKPVIGTNWSGNTDFMNSENSLLVNYNLIRINEDFGPYKAHQIWADPDIVHAGNHMKTLVENKGLYDQIGAKGTETILKNYSPTFVGQKVFSRLKELNLL